MATKKYLELQEMTEKDILNELQETSNQYQKLKFDHTIKGLDNPIGLREVRRDLARLKTEISKRGLEQMSEKDLSTRSKIRIRRRKQK